MWILAALVAAGLALVGILIALFSQSLKADDPDRLLSRYGGE